MGQTVALARRDDGDWVVRFRQFELAVLDNESDTIGVDRLSRSGLPLTVTMPVATVDSAMGGEAIPA